MTAPALPAPLPAFRQLARPCQAPGCPNVLSRADVGGLCLACVAEQEQAKTARPKYGVCLVAGCYDPVYRDGRCVRHFREYHREHARARKAKA